MPSDSIRGLEAHSEVETFFVLTQALRTYGDLTGTQLQRVPGLNTVSGILNEPAAFSPAHPSLTAGSIGNLTKDKPNAGGGEGQKLSCSSFLFPWNRTRCCDPRLPQRRGRKVLSLR